MKSFTLLPSIDRLLSGAIAVVKRFPLALQCATVASILVVVVIEHRDVHEPSILLKLIVTLLLGLPLFIALALASENRNWSVRTRILSQVIGLAVLAAHYATVPIDLFNPANTAIRQVILGFGLHFLVAIAPFVGRRLERGFWQYNKSLLLGLLTSVFYSAALFFGLTIALAAADYLFGFDVQPETYGEMFVLMAGIVNTWIFLALIPVDLKALETSEEYPGGLKIFSQYVLLPLVGLYFVILIAYEAKIIVEWNWPKGWVSQLVLWYSVVGVLSLLLLHPLKDRTDSKWIGKFGDWFFRLLVPLVIMLFLAIRRRIAEYGVTEPRYLVLILAVGLSVVVIYFLFSRRKDIRIIPIVLVCLAVIAAYGPLSASSVSTWSQTSRLDEMLAKHGLLRDGALQKPEVTVPLEARREMSSVISYLNESQGPSVFAKWLPDNIITQLSAQYESESKRLSANDSVASHLGFGFNWSRYYTMEGDYVSLWTAESRALNVAGFDKMLSFSYPPGEGLDSVMNYEVDGYTCRAQLLPNSSTLEILLSAPEKAEVLIDLASRVEQLYLMDNPRAIPQDSLTFDRTVGTIAVRVLVQSLSGQKADSVLDLTNLRAKILIGKRL